MYRTRLSISLLLTLLFSPVTASDDETFDVVIVGGGLAGLSTAHTIVPQVPNTLVLEAKNHLGGRVQTHHYEDGTHAELGGRFIEPTHGAILSLVEQFKLSLNKVGYGGVITAFRENGLLFEDELFDHFVSLVEKLQSVKSSWLSINPTERLEGKEGWYHKGFPQGLKLTDLEAAILNAIVSDEDGVDLEKLGFAAYMSTLERLEEYLELLGARQQIPHDQIPNYNMEIEGGNDQLVAALAEEIGQKRIRSNSPVVRISHASGRYKIDIKGGDPVFANKLVLATPFTVLRSEHGILDDTSLKIPDIVRETIDNLGYGTNSKVLVKAKLSKPLTYAIGLERSAVAWSNPAGITFMLGGELGKDVSDEDKETYAALTGHLSTLTGAIQDGDIIVKNWRADPYALGSYSATEVGKIMHLYQGAKLQGLYAHANPLNGNTLFFVGEHTSTDGGYMNSAIQSGVIVGEFLLTQLDD